MSPATNQRVSARRAARPSEQASAATPQAKRRALRIVDRLSRAIPSPEVELDHRNALELLMATILSAQCTDQRVNQVTPALFAKYRRAEDYAGADPAELEAIIRTTGFFKSKAKSLIACGQALAARFNGKVPDRMEDLVTLPGVGRKTANVILGACFGQPAVVVDTHVKRVSNRLALARSEDPEKIETALQHLLPPQLWTSGSQRLLLHGRYTCLARAPRCERCRVYEACTWEGKRPR
jgi:endonuclease III